MPAKGKGKRKVTTGPMDPCKTREPVTGHSDSDINAALDTVMLSPPHTDKGYDTDSSVVTTTTTIAITAPPPPQTRIAETRELAQKLLTPDNALTTRVNKVLAEPPEVQPHAMCLILELVATLEVELMMK